VKNLLSAFGRSFGGTLIVGTSIPRSLGTPSILNLPDAGRNPAGAHPVAEKPATVGEVLVGDANLRDFSGFSSSRPNDRSGHKEGYRARRGRHKSRQVDHAGHQMVEGDGAFEGVAAPPLFDDRSEPQRLDKQRSKHLAPAGDVAPTPTANQ
jgi:hypothetical protein